MLLGTSGSACGQIDVELSDGFSISKVAGDELATNIFCMTLNSQGQPVVSGPGYIKTLVDLDGDGEFDQARLFADGPATGAQGMLFEGHELLCTGDAGLLRFEDADGDGEADSPPQTLMPIKTGGEHFAHALRRGPDGWLYLIAGNQTPILPEYFNGQNSPVKNPEAGFLMRISPDFKTREIVVHGFRNAYDFDFNSAGEMFAYDSDGERDITLPWYRPTRVFQVRPGDHAGWISEGWKRPSGNFDMPTEIGDLGRGSPTGVCCYEGGQFPANYREAVFVADWTFGRIVVFTRDSKTRKYDRGSDFALSQGQFGFAVTDLVVAADGSLLVSVGGRGTEGGVYRISSRLPPNPDLPLNEIEIASRQLDEQVRRLRSSTGRNGDHADNVKAIGLLTSPINELQLAALELLVGRRDDLISGNEFAASMNSVISQHLLTSDTTRSRLLFNIVRGLPENRAAQIAGSPDNESTDNLLVRIAGSPQPDERSALLLDCLSMLNDASANRQFVLRLAQLTMDGCGPAKQVPPVFHGCTPRMHLEFTAIQREKLVARISALYESFKDDTSSRSELLRIMAMVGDQLPQDLTFDPPQVDDVSGQIHWLICAANMKARFPRAAIVHSLLELNIKVAAQGRQTDLNWTRRLQELAKRLIENYEISRDLVESEDFGRPEHAFLHEALADSWKATSKTRFENVIAKDPAAATVEQFRIATSPPDKVDRELVRLCAAQPQLRDEAILALAADPTAADINLYKQGLASFDVAVIKRSAIALEKVLLTPDRDVQVGAFLAACRLGWDKQSVSVRDPLIQLLQQQTGQQFGYLPRMPGKTQNDVLDAWRTWLESRYPDDRRLQVTASTEWMNVLERVNWSGGDVDRGRELYQKQQCVLCHNGGSRQGPRLEGVTNRFSKRDLFRSIAMPSEQVSDRYRAIIVQTNDGLIYKGTVIYESVDGITLMEGAGKTVRLNTADIENRVDSDKSLMPEGLLDGVDAQGYADLFAYLKSQTDPP
jgi:putative membrane-bound dehydrogenase-like protein